MKNKSFPRVKTRVTEASLGCRTRDPRTALIYRRLTDSTHPRILLENEKAKPSEISIDSSWSINCPESLPEMVKVAALDLERFLKDGMDCRLSSGKNARSFISVRVEPESYMKKNSSKREHSIDVSPDMVSISAASEWGVACGLYHLQRLLRLRRAPRLQLGKIHAVPVLEPSLTHLAFKRGSMDDLNFPEAYDEAYLIRLARAGYTGFHLDLCVDLFCQSKVLPEMNNSRATGNLADLRKIVRLSRKYALEVYVVLYNYPPLLSPEHPVFQKHPDLKGSTIVRCGEKRILCSSHPLVRCFYEEQSALLIRQGIEGLFLIVGCEGLLHCYTAPGSRPHNQTDCPRCGKRNPEKTVSALVNGIAAAAKRERPDALVAIWTYGNHTWNRNTMQFVSQLSRDCGFMCNFDTNDKCQREGIEGIFTDYTLTCVGPSAEFKAQIASAKRCGLTIMAKLESGCPREMHNVPSIPANTRWARKYENVLKSGVSGAVFVWEFTGYTGEIPGELAAWMSWRPCPPSGELLKRIAAREFGKDNVAIMMDAWRCFDRAMDYFPFSGNVIHFARGPLFIGFTHPLILDPHHLDGLSPQFWLRPGKIHQLFDMDLGWTHPFGAEKCLRSFQKMERRWKQGCSLLEKAVPPGRSNQYANAKLMEHQALGRGILCTLRTAINLILFYIIRDRYLHEASNLSLVRCRLTELRNIAKEELANAEEGLCCMRRNLLIGHDYVNGGEFTVEMAESKIAHTRKLMDEELPLRMFDHSYSMKSRDETLRDDGRKWR